MDFSKVFKTDLDAEVKGKWFNLDTETRLRVARQGNERNREVFTQKTAEYQAGLNGKVISEELSKKLLIEIMAETILLDWEGVEDEGKVIPYTRENAVMMLTKYKDFRDIVTAISTSMEAFKVQQTEAATKNS